MFTSIIKWENELDNLIRLSNEGLTFQAIGEKYGVSRQRIKQIFHKFGLTHRGIRYLVKLRQEAEQVDWQLKWGDKDDTELYRAKRDKYRSKKSNAKRSGIPFEIEFGEIDFPDLCPILKIPIDYFSEGRSENSPSFDRINPAKGYVTGNVVVMSWRANRIKNDGTAEEHKLIYEYLIKQNE